MVICDTGVRGVGALLAVGVAHPVCPDRLERVLAGRVLEDQGVMSLEISAAAAEAMTDSRVGVRSAI